MLNFVIYFYYYVPVVVVVLFGVKMVRKSMKRDEEIRRSRERSDE